MHVYFIGSKSLSRWRAKAQAFFTASVEQAEGKPVSTDFNTDVLCPHGRLLCNDVLSGISPLRCVPASIWQPLVSLFQGSASAVPEYLANWQQQHLDLGEEGCVCCECVAAIGDLRERAQRELEALSDLTALLAASPANEIDNCRDLNVLINQTSTR